MKGPGRPSIGLERMLCIHFLPYAFNLADPAVEDTLYDSCAVRAFVGIDLGQRLFAALGSHVRDQSLKIGIGTIVDATILSAPPRHQAGVRFREDAPPRSAPRTRTGFFAVLGIDQAVHVLRLTQA